MELTREQQKLVWGLVAVALIGITVFVYRHYAAPPQEALLMEAERVPSEGFKSSPSIILIHVAGAVKQAGVYRLALGKRVVDAITAAGGPLKGADLSALNLAKVLTDGEKVALPVVDLPRRNVGAAPGSKRDSLSAGPVNLNQADEKQLDTLPGIGPAMAKKIVTYRQEHGSFQALEELKEVPGIGDSKFARLKDLVTLN